MILWPHEAVPKFRFFIRFVRAPEMRVWWAFNLPCWQWRESLYNLEDCWHQLVIVHCEGRGWSAHWVPE
jgi:hypothetical protein